MAFSQRSRDIYEEWGPALFGSALRSDMAAKGLWETEAGSSVRALGVGGSAYGRGANLLLIDDYFGKIQQAQSETERKRIHEWFYGTIHNRLEPDASVVLVASRTHRMDLNGKVWEDGQRGGDRWERIRMPAIGSDGASLWPERWSIDALAKIKNGYVAAGYPWIWDWLYQQDGPDVVDAEFPAEYFDESIWFTRWPERLAYRVLSLDPSLGRSEKSDFSAIIRLGLDREGILWVEADLQRRDTARIVRDMLDHGRSWHPDAVGVESNQFQAILAGQIAEESAATGFMLPIWEMHNTGSKLDRIRRLTPWLARKKVRFLQGSPGTSLLVDQLRAFPTCKHDDGPDALEMAVRLVSQLFRGAAEPEVDQDVFEQIGLR